MSFRLKGGNFFQSDNKPNTNLTKKKKSQQGQMFFIKRKNKNKNSFTYVKEHQ